MKLSLPRFAVFTLGAGLLCSVPAFAQTDAAPSAPAQSDAPPAQSYGGPHRGGPEHRLEMLQRSLNLTPDQTTQVKALLETERSKMEALRGSSSAAPEDRRTQMMAIHQDTDTKVRALLTPDQVTKYDAMQARMREHRPGSGGAPPPDSSQAPGDR